MTTGSSLLRAPEKLAEAGSTDRLAALERVWRRFDNPETLLSRGGRVAEISPTHYKVRGLSGIARLGDIVEQRGKAGARRGEIVRIGRDEVVVAPFERSADAGIGDAVFRRGPLGVAPHVSWRGRAIDALTRAIDGGPPLVRPDAAGGADTVTPGAMSRQRVGTGFLTGVRVIDIFTPLCFGQRLGIFAGSGVGKSTLLAMLAGAEAFDTVVVALIGERGREVREFLEDTIGADSMAKTIAVVATSDESAMMRRRAPDTAMCVAEHFRDQGHRVLLVLDSITRFAHALREVATGTGEPPVARGYPASVFTDLPKLLERAGPGAEGKGSITAIISVLVDGDDHNDPVADSVRGILDGHVVLDRAIAEQGRYPPVNPLSSISRLADKVWSAEQRMLVTRLKSMIVRFEDTRDIRLLGAYQGGADAELDIAVRQVPLIYEALTQSPKDRASADPFADLARHLKGKQNGDQGD
ncbi:flagellar protein export ATPase FliI [Mesorhizobium sp. M1C.F.Ca.ET.193.01.1.1]|uniref:flagellar protein export ATPase FliI n=1 Tax=unclassified Mesorhizobium TaxID=325217 RepID=UPI000FD5F68C|nr:MULTISPECIES: flagellar protein export ATPase FliI [unclassified Mesorhizobium]TGS98840.1 flagellar protein export ATPase FliI [bacterium M00.F.Ca.ET.177.01.1.1]TGQ52865.1 flagellar protein export ATPase FliI [Mesorhizobium sp. M1C.F.Ca.ET.210.01.1.1]TGQ70151.1 flagellar protein export ATPase FliI [Mesorhizobium sp. M1C.F.Ca.ET.212.01.1.1]TGR05949.1 flagellar protein export ATPase FliI [Mesorhizobium sp. M1C.F.Ca.ET.204.01.1.1]TGR26688.1 flagellar protein export ATPase FliI [Mesorhizobium s